MKFTALPTWLLVKLARRWMAPSHPWYGRRFSLADWHCRRTRLCRIFDLFWFIYALQLVILGWMWVAGR